MSSPSDPSPPPSSAPPPAGDRPSSSTPPPAAGSSGGETSSDSGRPSRHHLTGPYQLDRCKDHEGRNSKIINMWDIGNAQLPNARPRRGLRPLPFEQILFNIRDAPSRLVNTAGMMIQAYGNGGFTQENNDALLTAPNVQFNLVEGKKQAAVRKLIVDLMIWATMHPPPAYIFLISGNGDFIDTLRTLISRGYTVLLAYPANHHKSLLPLAAYSIPYLNLVCDVDVDADGAVAAGDVAASAGYHDADVGAPLDAAVRGADGSCAVCDVDVDADGAVAAGNVAASSGYHDADVGAPLDAAVRGADGAAVLTDL